MAKDVMVHRFLKAQEAVWTERMRQEDKFGYDGTCANPNMAPLRALAILTEENGEVARELCDAFNEDRVIDYGRLRTELVQVAAVAVAWIEGIDARES